MTTNIYDVTELEFYVNHVMERKLKFAQCDGEDNLFMVTSVDGKHNFTLRATREEIKAKGEEIRSTVINNMIQWSAWCTTATVVDNGTLGDKVLKFPNGLSVRLSATQSAFASTTPDMEEYQEHATPNQFFYWLKRYF